jgi:hypothetical protein
MALSTAKNMLKINQTRHFIVFKREELVSAEHNRKRKRNEAFLLDKQTCASVEMLNK